MVKIYRSDARPYVEPGKGIVFPFSDEDTTAMNEAVHSGKRLLMVTAYDDELYKVLLVEVVECKP